MRARTTFRVMTARFACAALLIAAAASAQDTTAVKRELLAFDKALATRSADGTDLRLLEFSDSNAAILIPGQPIVSASGAQKIFHDRYFGKYDWRPAAAIASADGNFGCTLGFSTLYEVKEKGAQAVVHKGAYVACFRRSGPKQWRLVALHRADTQKDPPALWGNKQLPAKMVPASASSMYGSGAEQLAGAISADSAFAREAEKPEGPGPAFVHWASDDAIPILATKPTIGKEQIATYLADYPGTLVLLWDPAREFGYASGGLAYTVGNARTRHRSGGTDTNPQKYLTVWRQNPDHSWSWIVDLGSPR